MKKQFILISLILSMLLFVGCGGYKYENLFTDNAAKLSSTSGTSFELYTYTVRGDYGEMKVFLDTTMGYTFVKDDDLATFQVKDSEGNIVIDAKILDLENYKIATSNCENVKKINGRDFFYIDSTKECLSYMADCGLNAGLYMVALSGNEDDLGLVAFRGVAINGSSSDINAYKGKADKSEAKEKETTSDETPADTEVEEADEIDIEEKLNLLESDYNKVKWNDTMTPVEDKPSFVVNAIPYSDKDKDFLCISMTNLYDKPIAFKGLIQANDKDKAVIGDVFVDEQCIGAGNTVLAYIECIGTPDGTLSFENCELEDSKDTYIPWEADYSLTGNKDSDVGNLSISFYASDEEDMVIDSIDILLLDENGKIIDKSICVSSDELVKAGDKYEAEVSINIGIDNLLKTKDIALFANPKSE